MNIIKPQQINIGDSIGIIAPAGVIKDESLWQTATEYFSSKGYKIKIAPNAKNQNQYLAGSDEQRLNDLIDFFKDDEINAIICARGGYGACRLLDKIDYSVIRKNPKIFIGYSDITALHMAFYKYAGLSTFHGPLFLSDFGHNNINKYTESSLLNILSSPYKSTIINPYHPTCINEGEAYGDLIGGNLAVITSLIGTDYLPDFENKILFLEDIGEPLYKIDRMLTQLRLSGIFDKLSGLIFGEFTEIEESPDQIINLIRNETSCLKIPIAYNFPCGHNSTKATLPLGIEYYFNSKDFELLIQN